MRRVRTRPTSPPIRRMALALLILAAVTNGRCARLQCRATGAELRGVRRLVRGLGDRDGVRVHQVVQGRPGIGPARRRARRTSATTATSASTCAPPSGSRRRRRLRTADVVTWNIGFNDFGYARSQFLEGTCGGPDNQDCLRVGRRNVQRELTPSSRRSRRRLTNPTAVFRTMDIFYSGGAAGDPSFAVTNPYLEQMNAHQVDGNIRAGGERAPALQWAGRDRRSCRP